MNAIELDSLETPIGKLIFGASEEGISFVSFGDDEKDLKEPTPGSKMKASETKLAFLLQLKQELSEYFDGNRTAFNVKLSMEGTKFQNKVWNELLNIPFGKTKTYQQQTKALGDPKAIRAVASANGKNKHAIIIPCHRVIGSDGSLIGYAGGMWRKKWLLEFEQKHSGQFVQKELF